MARAKPKLEDYLTEMYSLDKKCITGASCGFFFCCSVACSDASQGTDESEWVKAAERYL
jgi:hypothetical protein